MDVARGRPRPARVPRRRRQVCGGTASRSGHRARGRPGRASAGGRGGHIRRARADERPHRHGDDEQRAPGIGHTSRPLARQERLRRRRRRAGSGARALGRAGARRPVRPPRDQGLGRRVRGPALVAPAAECRSPSAGTRGAARTGSSARSRPAAGACGASRRAIACRSSARGQAGGVAPRVEPALAPRRGSGAERRVGAGGSGGGAGSYDLPGRGCGRRRCIGGARRDVHGARLARHGSSRVRRPDIHCTEWDRLPAGREPVRADARSLSLGRGGARAIRSEWAVDTRRSIGGALASPRRRRRGVAHVLRRAGTARRVHAGEPRGAREELPHAHVPAPGRRPPRPRRGRHRGARRRPRSAPGPPKPTPYDWRP
jgi:hypothetical protein